MKHDSCDARSSVAGLPLWQVGRLGRQVLEGLLFLADRGFPPYRHLHSGNVILQNGVARFAPPHPTAQNLGQLKNGNLICYNRPHIWQLPQDIRAGEHAAGHASAPALPPPPGGARARPPHVRDVCRLYVGLPRTHPGTSAARSGEVSTGGSSSLYPSMQ